MEFFKDIVRKMKSVPTDNTFERDGKITPEQFVAAGDNLVFKFPSWRWDGGHDDKRLPYLPPNKQFLTTRVLCKRRATSLHAGQEETLLRDETEEDPDTWVATNTDVHRLEASAAPEELAEIPSTAPATAKPAAPAPAPPPMEHKGKEEEEEEDVDDDDIPDLDLANIPSEEADPSAAPAPAPAGQVGEGECHTLAARTYNVLITYDLFYQSPRVWLSGISEDGTTPLRKEQIFEDISEDHAKKTVTIEPHPHIGLPMASIHPCKHASVMKEFSDRMAEAGKRLRPEQYFFLFLKFLSAVCPTIELDYTMEMEG